MYEEREKSELGGGWGGWVGQTQDFPLEDQGLSPVCDQSRLVFNMHYIGDITNVSNVGDVAVTEHHNLISP